MRSDFIKICLQKNRSGQKAGSPICLVRFICLPHSIFSFRICYLRFVKKIMGLLIGTLKMRQIIKDQRLKRTQI